MQSILKRKIFFGLLGMVTPGMVLGSWYLHGAMNTRMHLMGMLTWPGWVLMVFNPIMSPAEVTPYSFCLLGFAVVTNVVLYIWLGSLIYRRYMKNK